MFRNELVVARKMLSEKIYNVNSYTGRARIFIGASVIFSHTLSKRKQRVLPRHACATYEIVMAHKQLWPQIVMATKSCGPQIVMAHK